MTDNQNEPQIHISLAVPVTTVDPDATTIPTALIDSADAHIQEHGFVLVGDGLAHKDDERSVTYSLGLHKRHLPDILSLGYCACHDEVVGQLATRQLKAGPYEDGQITQVHGAFVRLTTWPHTGGLNMYNTYYARFGGLPRLLLAEVIE